jgi:hypothetical protein
VGYDISLKEINCTEKTTRFLSLNYFDNNRKAILSGSIQGKLIFIVPDTVEERLFKIICK